MLIPTLAVPIAWVQYGPESGIILLLAAAMMFWRHKNGLHRIFFRAGKTIFPPQKLRISYHGRAKKAILRRKTNGETAKNKKLEKIRKKFKKSVDI